MKRSRAHDVKQKGFEHKDRRLALEVARLVAEQEPGRERERASESESERERERGREGENKHLTYNAACASMYVHVHVHVYVSVYVHVHAHVYVHMYVYVHECIIYIYIYMYIHMLKRRSKEQHCARAKGLPFTPHVLTPWKSRRNAPREPEFTPRLSPASTRLA